MPQKTKETSNDFVVIESTAPSVEMLAKQIGKLVIENSKIRQQLDIMQLDASHPAFYVATPDNLSKAIRLVVQWQKALEEGLLRTHFPERFPKFDPNSRRLKDIYGIIRDAPVITKFFKKKSVRRIRQISKLPEFKVLEAYAHSTTLPITLNILEISSLMVDVADNEDSYDEEETYLFDCLYKVYCELVGQNYHKILAKTCFDGRAAEKASRSN